MWNKREVKAKEYIKLPESSTNKQRTDIYTCSNSNTHIAFARMRWKKYIFRDILMGLIISRRAIFFASFHFFCSDTFFFLSKYEMREGGRDRDIWVRINNKQIIFYEKSTYTKLYSEAALENIFKRSKPHPKQKTKNESHSVKWNEHKKAQQKTRHMKTHLTMNDRAENPRTMNLMLRLFIYLFLIFSYNVCFCCCFCTESASTYVLWCRCIVHKVHIITSRHWSNQRMRKWKKKWNTHTHTHTRTKNIYNGQR